MQKKKPVNFDFETFIKKTVMFEMETHRPLSIKMNCVYHRGQPDEFRLTEHYIYLVSKLKMQSNFLTRDQKLLCRTLGIDLKAQEDFIETVEDKKL